MDSVGDREQVRVSLWLKLYCKNIETFDQWIFPGNDPICFLLPDGISIPLGDLFCSHYVLSLNHVLAFGLLFL